MDNEISIGLIVLAVLSYALAPRLPVREGVTIGAAVVIIVTFLLALYFVCRRFV